MIPTIIFLILRRYGKYNPQAAELIRRRILIIGRVVTASIILILISTYTLAQDRKLEYSIKRNDRQVGKMTLLESVKGNRTELTLYSDVNAGIIMKIRLRSEERSIYENGILKTSSVYRTQNGQVKTNSNIQLNGNGYSVTRGKKQETGNMSAIHFNMLLLYLKEPREEKVVYSDNLNQFLQVEKLPGSAYRIRFPDGNHNMYYYSQGICSKVKINHSLYSATIELIK